MHAKIVAVVGFSALVLVVGLVLTRSGIVSSWQSYWLWVPTVALVYWPLALAVLRDRYDERGYQREPQREQQHQVGVRARADRVLARYFMPLLALLMLVTALANLSPSLRASRGGGRVGTLELTSQQCDRYTCTWYGTFRSDDGQLVWPDAIMHDPVPAGAQTGDEIRARDAGDHTGVFSVTGSSNWRTLTLMAVLGGGYLIGWAIWLTRRIWWTRRPALVEVPAGLVPDRPVSEGRTTSRKPRRAKRSRRGRR